MRQEARPFDAKALDEVRRPASISQNRIVPLKRVCTQACVARSSVYFARKADEHALGAPRDSKNARSDA